MIKKSLKTTAASFALAGAGLTGAGIYLAADYLRKRKHRQLLGKVVLITGGSRGLGLALAEEFARYGTRLALTARNLEELERARKLVLKRHRNLHSDDVFVAAADLRNSSEAESLVKQITERFGRVDILVNNAGIITAGPVENQPVEEFRNVMDANFFSGLHCTLAVLPQMLARRSGAIVNITSIGGKIAVPHLLPYTASKFAAVGFSEGLYAELRSKGIRVTTVCPGLMRTGSHLNALFTGDAEREYRWFSLSAGLPGVSTSAAKAAAKIVRAVIASRSEIAITPQAILAARFGNLCPEATLRAMSAMNTALPKPVPGQSHPYKGAEVRSKEIRPALTLASSAARRYNQVH
jgi:short-subunit dehydrogenase